MKVAPTVADAIAGAQYRAPTRQSKKSVLIAGASGRLGERILARLLGTPEYQQIYALASTAVPSTEPKLTTLNQADWAFRVDHVIAVISEDISGGLQARNRTEVFSTLAADQVVPFAEHARSLGVSRFMVVTPINVLLQPSAVYAQLASVMEVELHRIGFDALILVRPSDHAFRQSQKDWARRLPSLLLDTVASLLTGTRHTPLSIENVARATVRAMQDNVQGLSILEPDHLHQIIQS